MTGRDWSPAAAGRFRPGGTIATAFYRPAARASSTPWYFNWDLHHVVDVFTTFEGELQAIRETAAMGDMSPLAKCVVAGPDAARFVDHVITRDASKLEVGQILYTPWCTEAGKVVTDGLVFRIDEHSYRFTGDPSTEWFASQTAGFDVSIEDVTDELGILALQGPRSREVLEVATGRDWSHLDFSRMVGARLGGVAVEVARQGFTGELGYEILTPFDGGDSVWETIATAGASLGIRAAGEHAIDVARVEAGMLIPGPDYANAGPDPVGSHTRSATEEDYVSSPFELGMGAFVDFGKGEFIGRQALLEEHAAGGPVRTLVGLDIDWRAIVALHLDRDVPPNVSPRVRWEPLAVHADNVPIGRASSITWGPSVHKVIGFGHLARSHSRPGTRVAVSWPIGGDHAPVAAAVVELPFLPRRRAG